MEVMVATGSCDILVAQLSPGHFFGELVLLLVPDMIPSLSLTGSPPPLQEDMPRESSVIAKGTVTCAWLPRSGFAELTSLSPSAALGMNCAYHPPSFLVALLSSPCRPRSLELACGAGRTLSRVVRDVVPSHSA